MRVVASRVGLPPLPFAVMERERRRKRRVQMCADDEPDFVALRLAALFQRHRGTFDLKLLTDWTIESPRGRYTPESVLQLERSLANVPARPLLN